MGDYYEGSFEECVESLKKVQDGSYGTQEGVVGLSKLVLNLSTTDVFKFSEEWLAQLEDCVKSDWSEDHILRMVYIAHDVISRGQRIGEHPAAFKKVLLPAMKIFRSALYGKKPSVEKILNLWNDWKVYDANFIGSLYLALGSHPPHLKRQGSDLSSHSAPKRSRKLSVDAEPLETEQEDEEDDEDNAYKLSEQDKLDIFSAKTRRKSSFASKPDPSLQLLLTSNAKSRQAVEQCRTHWKETNAKSMLNIDYLEIELNNDSISLDGMKEKFAVLDELERSLRKLCSAHVYSAVIKKGVQKIINDNLQSVDESMEKDIADIESWETIQKEIEDKRKDNKEDILEVKLIRRVVDKRTVREQVEEKKRKEKEEMEKKNRANQGTRAMQWDKLLKAYVPVPEIGEIESWRER